MKTYRVQPVDGLARVLVVLLALAGVVNLVNAMFDFAFWQDAALILPLADRGTFATFPAPQGPVPTMFGAVGSLAGLGAGITWLMWQHHVTANLWARGVPMKMTPGWAVAWWFIPFVNLVMPYVGVREVDLRSAERSSAAGRSRRLVGWWWGVYMAATVGPVVAFFSVFFGQGRRFIDAVESEAPSIDLTIAMRQLASWSLVAGVASLVAAALAILVVRRITELQADLIRGPMPPRPDVDLAWMPAPPG